MHFRMNELADNFAFEDLQLVDGPPMRGARTVVSSACSVLNVAGAALIVFDDIASLAVARERAGYMSICDDYPLAGSLAADVRGSLASIRVNDLTQRSAALPERRALAAASLMAAPVMAPDGRAAGMLAVMGERPRHWTSRDISKLEDLAYLISQEIILRASFATLGILARERSRFRN